jgi:hypothetical protein
MLAISKVFSTTPERAGKADQSISYLGCNRTVKSRTIVSGSSPSYIRAAERECRSPKLVAGVTTRSTALSPAFFNNATKSAGQSPTTHLR